MKANVLFSLFSLSILTIVACQSEPNPLESIPPPPTLTFDTPVPLQTGEFAQSERATLTPTVTTAPTAIPAAAETVETSSDQPAAVDHAEGTSPSFFFGTGANLHVMDPNGERKLEFGIEPSRFQTLTAQLFPLSTERFIAEYNTNSREIGRIDKPDPFNIPADLSAAYEWSFDLETTTDQVISAWLTIPPEVPSGFYMLQLLGEADRDSLFLHISPNRLRVKGSYGEIVAILSTSDDMPRPNAAVTLYDKSGTALTQSVTNESGEARLLIPQGSYENENSLAFLLADSEGEVTFAGLTRSDGGATVDYRYEVWCTWYDEWTNSTPFTNRYRFYTVTNLSAYQPGETVEFKSVVRLDRDGRFEEIAAGTPVQVSLMDDEVLLDSISLQTNRFGTLNGSFPLPSAVGNDSFFSIEEFDLRFEINGETHLHHVLLTEPPAKAPFDIRLSTDKATFTIGEPIEIEMEVISLDGIPFSAINEVDLIQSVWERIFTSPPSKPIKWRRPVSLLQSEDEAPKAELGGDGMLSLTFDSSEIKHDPAAADPLQIGFEAVVAYEEIEIRTFLTVDVFDPDRSFLPERNIQDELNMIAENDLVRQGEVAKLIISSSFDGPALLTVERGSLLRSLPVNLTAPVTEVELPILPEDAPNIVALISAFKPTAASDSALLNFVSESDHLYLQDRVEIIVPVENKRLDVEILPGSDTYQPGDLGSFIVRVTNSGVPVSAEVLLQLSDAESTPILAYHDDPFYDFFYEGAPHSVATFSSYGTQRKFEPPQGGGCGGGGGGVYLPGRDIERDSIWLPNLETDYKGEAEIQVEIPATSGSWRISAFAVTADTQLGEGELIIKN